MSLEPADELWDAEVAEQYDTPGTGMFAPEVIEPTVDQLVELADGGPVLEFAIGTGRVAVPLAKRGVRVSGIELSEPMIAQLRTKVDEATIPVVAGDMTTTRVPGEFSLVYLVFNTISNLLTQAAQVECFRNAARHLSPGRSLRHRALGARAARPPARQVRHGVPFRARLSRRRHL